MKYDRNEIPKHKIEEAVKNTHSMIAAAKYLNISRDKFNKYAKMYDLFSPNQSGKNTKKRRIYSNEYIFSNKDCRISQTVLITRLKELRPWVCENCGLFEWRGEPLTLEIHHIDGNPCNNEINNLQLLCPNCHSLTSNWRSRNIKGYNKTKPKVSDDDILRELEKHKSIYSALQALGLSGGSNYNRVYKLIKNKT